MFKVANFPMTWSQLFKRAEFSHLHTKKTSLPTDFTDKSNKAQGWHLLNISDKSPVSPYCYVPSCGVLVLLKLHWKQADTMLSFSQLAGHFLQLKARRNFLFSAQTGKKTRPFLFKINCPWKARSDSVSLGPRRALCCLFLAILWPLASRSMNQHTEEELQDRNSPILPLSLQLILLWIPVLHLTSPCAWDDLLFFLMTDLPTSPVAGSLNLYLNLPHYFTQKKLASNHVWS